MDLKIELTKPDNNKGGVPTTAAQLRSQATVGALLAIFGCGDTLLRLGKMDKRLHQKMGIPALQRMYNEADRMNRGFEKLWDVGAADQMGFLHTDTAIVMMVMASVDMESRTNLSNEFRKVWAQLMDNVGDDEALVNVLLEVKRIREERGLIPRDSEGVGESDVFDEITFTDNEGQTHNLGELVREPPTAKQMLAKAMQANQDYYTSEDFARMDEEEASQKQRELDLIPNCMVFVRTVTGELIEKATIVVMEKPEKQEEASRLIERFEYDANGIFERRYPTEKVLVFTVLANGFLPGGREKYFYPNDPDQIVLNITLQQAPSE